MYFFKELSQDAQKKAIVDYKYGWAETHPNDYLSDQDVRTILAIDLKDDLYEEDGTLIVDDDIVSEHDFPFIIGV